MNNKYHFRTKIPYSDVYMICSNNGINVRTQIKDVLYWAAQSHNRSIACYDEKFGFDIEPGDTVDSILKMIREKTMQTERK